MTAVPRCLIFEIYKPRWKTILLKCAIIALASALLIAVVERPLEEALVTSAVFGVAIGSTCLTLIAWDLIRIHLAKRTLKCLVGNGEVSSDARIAALVLRQALCGGPDLPGRCLAKQGPPLPEVVLLADRRFIQFLFTAQLNRQATRKEVLSLYTPQSSSVPFEPIPLGDDPTRSSALLEEFLGLKYEGAPEAIHPLVFCLVGRTDPRTFSGWVSAIFSAGCLTFLLTRLIVPSPFLVLPILFIAILICHFMYVRMVRAFVQEYVADRVWLFPGVIGVRLAQPGRGSKELVCRRGDGTLWYDAQAKKLHLPLREGGHHKLRCGPADALLTSWAWINTAKPPDNIQLESIA